MAIARAHLVDVSITRWYHCITRCVRRAFLLGQEPHNRKAWIEHRLQELAEIFAVSVGGFSVMDNHLHLLVRLDPDAANDWSDEQVVRRWGRLFPPRNKSREPLPVTKAWVEWRLRDAKWVATARERLQSLSWFMKCLKEPLARLANKQDKARGAFFEERFKSVAILDEGALLATCAYIDLNPVAAGIVDVPEASPHTSITTRVEHVKEQGRLADLTTAGTAIAPGPNRAEANSHGLQPLALASNASVGLEESIWLCPVEDRRYLDSSREGMLGGFSLGNYLLLVDYTGRLLRDG
jgi:REP element-mobilizing transposase RayT